MPVDGEPPFHIRLTKEQTFGNTDEVFIVSIQDVTVDSEGRVYIADKKDQKIKVYKPDGEFITRLGREGRGPGEFQNIFSVRSNQKRIFAFDMTQQRIHQFGLDPFEFKRSFNIAENKSDYSELKDISLGILYIRPDGSFVVRFDRPDRPEELSRWDQISSTGHYYLLDQDGEIVSRLFTEERTGVEVVIPREQFSIGTPISEYGKLLTAIGEELVYVSWSQNLLVRAYDRNGKLSHSFYYPYKRTPLIPEEVFSEGQMEMIRPGLSNMSLPEYLPALDVMLSDDRHRLWIATIVDDLNVYEWWVLEDSGKLLARFTLPRSKSIKVVKNGALYTKETDQQAGEQQIVRYRIEMEPSEN